MPIMLDNPESSWGLNGSIEQKLFDINFKFGLRHYATENAHQTNNLLKTSKTRNSTLRFSAKTLFDKFPILEIGYRQGLGKYSLDGEQSSEFFTSEPYLNLDYDFLKGFIASVNYSSFHYKNISWDERHNYQVANASLYYKKASSAWNFEIEAKNLFDVEFKNRNSFSAFVISDIRTYILPRILMFTVGYNL